MENRTTWQVSKRTPEHPSYEMHFSYMKSYIHIDEFSFLVPVEELYRKNRHFPESIKIQFRILETVFARCSLHYSSIDRWLLCDMMRWWCFFSFSIHRYWKCEKKVSNWIDFKTLSGKFFDFFFYKALLSDEVNCFMAECKKFNYFLEE